VGKVEGKRPLKDVGVDGKIMLEWILGKYVGECGQDSTGYGQGPVAGSCGLGNEPSCSIEGCEFHYQFNDCAFEVLCCMEIGS
jgi:hypothetical protein